MTIHVNRELCSGCGNCVSVCPSNAIHLEGGHAVIDMSLCAECRVCTDVCPQGAIVEAEGINSSLQPISLKTPAMTAQPLSIQSVERSRGIVAEPLPSERKSWLAAGLAFAAREILPRFVDALMDSLERRQKTTPALESKMKSLPPLSAQKSLREHHRLRQGGFGHRRRRQVRAREGEKGKWL